MSWKEASTAVTYSAILTGSPKFSSNCFDFLGLQMTVSLERGRGNGLGQWSPTFLAPGTSFVEDSFSMVGGVIWFGDDSSPLYSRLPPAVWPSF